MISLGLMLVVVGIVLCVLGLITVMLNANSPIFDFGAMPQEFLIGVFVGMCGLAFIIVGGVIILINRDS